MNTAKELRADILELLFKLNDVSVLESIRHQLEEVYSIEETKENLSFLKAVKPIRKGVKLEDLMKEQEYSPISYQEFREKVDQIKWEESLEELLSALSK